MNNPHPLAEMLQVAVPLWIHSFYQTPWSELQTQIQDLPSFSQVLTEKGDRLLYGGKTGEAAVLFNQLAKSIALMSFLPGGISTFGQHWESKHPKNDSELPPELLTSSND